MDSVENPYAMLENPHTHDGKTVINYQISNSSNGAKHDIGKGLIPFALFFCLVCYIHSL